MIAGIESAIAAIAGLIALVVGAWFAGRREERKAAKRKNIKARLNKAEVEREVNDADDEAVLDLLTGKRRK